MITPEYAGILSNPSIRTRLLNHFSDKGNFAELEAIVLEEKDELLRLQDLKKSGKIVISEAPKHEELSDILDWVKPEVDDFLGVSHDIMPDITYYIGGEPNVRINEFSGLVAGSIILAVAGEVINYIFDTNYLRGAFHAVAIGMFCYGIRLSREFTRQKGTHLPAQEGFPDTIILNETPREQAIPLIGHEYTHNIMAKQFPYADFPSLQEGVCRGVQKHIAQKSGERIGNVDPYMYCFQNYLAEELRIIYRWAAHQTGRKRPKKFTDFKVEFIVPRDKKESLNNPSRHALGHIALYFEEREQGPQIYSQILSGDFKFKKLV